MKKGLRSLNQSNSVAIATYEYLRQKSFDGLDLAFEE
jgi:tRNA(Leu) C34 or U34 (ribose-2'-O)-methylase TrmL